MSFLKRSEPRSGRALFPSDLLIVGWTALVYDRAKGAIPVLQLLEHAKYAF